MKRVIDGELVEGGEGMPALPVGHQGVFETVRLREGEFDLWDEHWDRFAAGCVGLGFRVPVERLMLLKAAAALAEVNRMQDGVVRYVAWHLHDGKATWQLDVGPPRPHMAKPQLRVMVSTVILPPAGPERAFKHLQRAEWMQALQDARSRGYDEAVLCDRAGIVVEASVSNVFFEKEGVLCTPAFKVGPLPGVMRAKVLAEARSSGRQVREGEFTVADLRSADAIWLTNSLIGMKQARLVD